MDWLEELESGKHRRQMLVGRAGKLYHEGKTAIEIAETLKISESSARSLIREFGPIVKDIAERKTENPN